MNRRQRRANRAWGERVPDRMVKTGQAMGQLLRQHAALGAEHAPRFALPPNTVLLIAPLDVGIVAEVVAQNPCAKELVRGFIEIGRALGGEAPTVNMLRAVLELEGVAYDTVPVSAFGTIGRDLAVMKRPDAGEAN